MARFCRCLEIPVADRRARSTGKCPGPSLRNTTDIDQITIGEISVNSVVSTPAELYVYFWNVTVAAAAPDYYVAAAGSLNAAATFLTQPADNRTATIRVP